MLKDRIENIDKYYSLDNSLRDFSNEVLLSAKEEESFSCDKLHTTLFFVEDGKSSFATSWRENELNREVLAVMRAQKGEFVLYLPGEPYVIRNDKNANVKVWRV